MCHTAASSPTILIIIYLQAQLPAVVAASDLFWVTGCRTLGFQWTASTMNKMVEFGSDANFEAKSARLDLAGESRQDPVLVAKLAPVGQRGNPPSWLRSIAPPPPVWASALWGYHGHVSYFARKVSGSRSTKLGRDKHTNADSQ